MQRKRREFFFSSLLILSSTLLLLTARPASNAQVTTKIVETTRAGLDLATRTSKTTDLVTNVTTTSITGGTRPGNGPNLFHSFDFFTVGSKDIAHFQNDMMLPTANIIARVIGDAAGLREASTIDGILRTNNPLNMNDPLNFGMANFYLINPAGVMLKQNAQLDVGGSINIATADNLRFNNVATLFDAAATPASLGPLHIASVAAFGFTNPRPVAISIEGSTLQVVSSQTLSLVAGDLTMTGGTLAAPAGQIHLASVASAGEVLPNLPGQSPNLDVSGFSSLGQISLSNAATVTVSSDLGAGTVLVRSGQFGMENSAALKADTSGTPNGAPLAVDLHVTGEAALRGSSLITAQTSGAGNAGTVEIKARDLTVASGAEINTNTSGAGSGGSIRVLGPAGGTAESVTLQGESLTGSSKLEARTTYTGPDPTASTPGVGAAGDVAITTKALVVEAGARINASTSGTGAGGNIVVMAPDGTVTLRGDGQMGRSSLEASTSGAGNAGHVVVTAQDVTVEAGAEINARTSGRGTGGNIVVTAPGGTVTVQGSSSRNYFQNVVDADSVDGGIFVGSGFSTSGLRAQTTSPEADAGTGGQITVETGTLTVADGALLSTRTFGPGRAGDMAVTATVQMLVQGSAPESTEDVPSRVISQASPYQAGDTVGPAGALVVRTPVLTVKEGALISTRTDGTGDAGSLTVETTTLMVADGGQLSTSTSFQGHGGDLRVQGLDGKAAESVTLQGEGGRGEFSGPSLLASNAGRSGNAGNVTITTKALTVANGAEINTSNYGSGAGGDIVVTAHEGTVTVKGRGQNVGISALRAQTISRDPGAGAGGSITVETKTLTVADGGALSATTFGQGDAGNIQVTATEQVLLQGSAPRGDLGGPTGGPSRLVSDAENGGLGIAAGAAGHIEVRTPILMVKDGARINTNTEGGGGAGDILVQGLLDGQLAQAVSLQGEGLYGPSQMKTTTSYQGSITAGAPRTGAAGDVEILTQALTVTDGAEINASTTGTGAGGNIMITARDGAVTIQGRGTAVGTSGLRAQTSRTGSGAGAGGTITVETKTLEVRDGGVLSTSTFGRGNAGNIAVTATERMTMQGSAPRLPGATGGPSFLGSSADVSGSVSAPGAAGNVVVTTPVLMVTGGAVITTSTNAAGRAGSITVQGGLDGQAAQAVTIQGESPDERSAGGPGPGRSRLESSTSGNGNAGNVTIKTQALTLADGGEINTSTSGRGQGGNIEVNAIGGTVTIQARGTAVGTSGLRAQTSRTGSNAGNGGSITVSAETLTVVDGGVLSTTTFGRGSAGNIAVTATEQVLVQGTSDPQGDSTGPTGGPSILISSAENSQVGSGPRNAGDIVVKTPILMVEDGGKISTSTLGGGQGGDIRVEGLDNQPAAAVTIEGEGPYGSSILEARTEGAGNAGEVEITTPVLTVRDGARISTDTRGIGNGGNIEITATGGTVVLQGSGTKGRSSLEASTSFSTGNAGDVTITTQDLRVEDGAEINSRTTGSGRGGNIRVEATNITVRGEVSEDRTPSFPDNIGLIDNDGFVNSGQVFIGSGFRTSGLRAQTKNTGGNTGPGGTITIETKTLTLADGGELNASTFSRGPAGSITLHVDSLNAGSNAEISSKSTLTSSGSGQAGNIVVQGLASPATSVSLTNSSLLTSVSGDGSGGSIMVETGVLTLDNATVSASVKNIPAGSDPTQGVGNVTLSATQEALITNGTVVTAQSDGTRHAGNVTIQAGNQFLSTNSRVTTEANATDADASGGSITVNAQDVIRLRDTTISASVSGNETTSGGNISIDPSLLLMQNSQIIAKASKGQGGNITIIAGTVLADASSSISASSQSGPQGTVNVQAPIQNLSGAMVPMPQAFKATTNLLAERCAARVNAGNTSTFAITTREGLPPEPGGPLSTPLEELDLAVTQTATGPLLLASSAPVAVGPTGEGRLAYATDQVCHR